jgi:hypothetical protein
MFNTFVKDWQARKNGAQASATKQRDVRVGQILAQRTQRWSGHDRVTNP